MHKHLDRLYFMDSMRATLMMLGVVIHSAQVFNPLQEWLIYSQSTTVIATFLSEVIHVFRMPAFFVVSGYFCLLTLKKYDTAQFLKIRLVRILIPLITTAITLNSLQIAILNQYAGKTFDLTNYLINGGYLSHLWFLTNLIIYFLSAAFCYHYFKPFFTGVAHLITQCYSKVSFIVLLLCLPIFSLAILSLNKLGFPLYSNLGNIFNTYSILIHAPFFFLGMSLAIKPHFIKRFCDLPLSLSIVLIVAIIVIEKNCVYNLTDIISGTPLLLVATYLAVLKSYLSVAICFFIFHRFLNSASKLALFLSDASYTVYLCHHVLVIIIGMALIHFEVSALVGLPLLILAVITLTLCIHKYIIKKNKLASYLFNGK